ncbi:MAG: hypothetical protein J6S42_08025, partial [Thermoguttaceae bacterium]|nr:hypothetical protein [Thermoguttaceae bacterium]
MKTAVGVIWAVLACLFSAAPAAGETTLETDTFRYVIAEDGTNVSLFDKSGEREYLRNEEPSFCAAAKVGGKEYRVSSVRFDGGVLRLAFDGASVRAEISVAARPGALVFEVAKIDGAPDELVFANVPLGLEAKPYEPFAACALALTPFTHVHQLPALHDAYWAAATARFGLVGAKAALIGVPQADILSTIRGVVTDEAVGIPFSDKGGAWALSSPDGRGSYMMDFGTLTEETVDEWIASCRRLG